MAKIVTFREIMVRLTTSNSYSRTFSKFRMLEQRLMWQCHLPTMVWRPITLPVFLTILLQNDASWIFEDTR